MSSVKYDNVELVNSTYNLQYARDHSAPEREFTIVPYATDDGSVIVFDRYGTKHIRVKGFISAVSESALQTAVDTFKELFSRRDKNLDITPTGGTLRRYVANCIRHTITGDYYNTTFLPYEAEFIVSEGVGKITTLTTMLSASYSADTSGTLSLSVGSTPEQKLRFTLTFTTAGDVAGAKIRVYNDTGVDLYNTAIIITKNVFADSDVLSVDCGNKNVEINGSDVAFYGSFPRAILGTSKTKYEITYSQILIESNPYVAANASTKPVYGALYEAQSFMVKHTDSTYRSVKAGLSITGSPSQNLVMTIEGDSSGAPDGSPVASFTVQASALSTSYQAITADGDENFTLDGNTKYWLVFKTSGGDSSNRYNIYGDVSSDPYSKGNESSSSDSGSTWTDDFDADLFFYIYFGGKAEASDLYSTDFNHRYIYKHAGFTSTIDDSFSSPSLGPYGLTYDDIGTTNIISLDNGLDRAFRHSGFTTTITNTFSTPSTAPYGLAFDSNHVYTSDDNSNLIYWHNGFSSTITSTIAIPNTSPRGLTHDGTNIYSVDGGAGLDRIYKHSGFATTISNTFSSPSTQPFGLTLDTETNICTSDGGGDDIYRHVGFSSSVAESFSSPSNGASDLAWLSSSKSFLVSTVIDYYARYL